MKLIAAPDQSPILSKEKTLFLAGGISNCRDWQRDMIEKLKKENLTLINPRRENWDMNADPEESARQIEWEHMMIGISKGIMFWFPNETLCPITLFELGAALRTHTNIFIGCDPDYKRKFDVEVQVSLVRSDITVHSSLDDLANDIIANF